MSRPAPRALPELARLFLQLGTPRLRRPRRPHRPDGGRGRAPARVAEPRGLPRPAGRHEPHPRAQLDRDGHPHRPRASRVAGLVVAGVCFIAPAVLIVLRAPGPTAVRHLPAAERLLRGVKPVIIAIVVQALWGLGRPRPERPLAVSGRRLAAVAAFRHELAVIFGAGRRGARGRVRAGRTRPRPRDPRWPLGAAGLPRRRPAPFELTSLFLVFLKIGSVLFGSGYVLLAFLRADLVERRGWLTESQLLDAVAVGQVTPGPVFTTATFVGYLLGGLGGAAWPRWGSSCRRSSSSPSAGRSSPGSAAPRGRRLPRRRQRGLDRPHGRRHLAARAGGDRRRLDDGDRRRERGPPPPLPREPGVAGARRRPARPRPPPLARASLAVEVGHERRRVAVARGGAPRDRRSIRARSSAESGSSSAPQRLGEPLAPPRADERHDVLAAREHPRDRELRRPWSPSPRRPRAASPPGPGCARGSRP